MTIRENAARLIKTIEAEQDQQLRQQALNDPNQFVRLAEQQGYRFSPRNLAEEITQLSAEAIAAIWNPGIGPRRHLVRR
ncbi:MAG: Nif11-like leader peptide family natural product precursor [Thermosynechococcaceae cyanobacterium]